MTELERLAKAWFDVDSARLSGMEAIPWSRQSESVRQGFKNDVRAILTAMRDPSKETVHTGGRAIGKQDACSSAGDCQRCDDPSFSGCRVNARIGFIAMIDHILNEEAV